MNDKWGSKLRFLTFNSCRESLKQQRWERRTAQQDKLGRCQRVPGEALRLALLTLTHQGPGSEISQKWPAAGCLWAAGSPPPHSTPYPPRPTRVLTQASLTFCTRSFEFQVRSYAGDGAPIWQAGSAAQGSPLKDTDGHRHRQTARQAFSTSIKPACFSSVPKDINQPLAMLLYCQHGIEQ